MASNPKFVFFGTPEYAIPVLNALGAKGFTPNLIVTAPDRPVGRKQIITPPPVKVWAQRHDVDVIQPENFKGEAVLERLVAERLNVFIVAAYGKILPKALLDLPVNGTLNIHPSLLPKFRGPSPVESTILADERETGVTIILLDEKVDHGPILAEKKITVDPWPVPARELEMMLFNEGGELLAEILPEWLQGEIKPKEQEHEKATFTHMLQKSDGEVSLTDDPYQLFLKFNAYNPWPGIFFFREKRERVIITKASFEYGNFVIESVIPEGSHEMPYEEYLKGR